MSKNGKVVSFEEAVACVQDYSNVLWQELRTLCFRTVPFRLWKIGF